MKWMKGQHCPYKPVLCQEGYCDYCQIFLDAKVVCWYFLCNDCGYKFRAQTPHVEFEERDECVMCHSKNFKKELISR